MRLLLVEDDHDLATGVEKALVSEGYIVDAVNTGEAALFLVQNTGADAVILDLGLPDMDGLDVLKAIRQHDRSLPVLLLTARDALEDKVAGLDGGADDYLTKPFDIAELVARLRVVARRAAGHKSSTIEIGPVLVDTRANTVFLSGKPLDLSSKEYALLRTLLENSGKLLSKDQLESKLYAWGEQLSSNAIEVHIHNLRKKLGKDFIKTVRGIGYGVGL